MLFNLNDIQQLERRYRGNLINSLSGYKSAMLLGTKSPEGNENLAIFSSAFHIGADPALCGVVVRPNEERENTLGNIVKTKIYTLNQIHESFIKAAHQTSAKYTDGISEFKEVGLTPQYRENVYAPFVQESHIKFACELVQKIDLTINGTFILIGNIVHVECPSECIQQDGTLDLEKAKSIAISGLNTYSIANRLTKLSYAKTSNEPYEID